MTSPRLDDLALSCRKLFLRRLEVLAHIGAHDFEKGVKQRLWIDVDLYVPYEHASPKQDRLHEVVDYDYVREVVARRIAQGHVELKETLCDDLAERLLAHPGVKALRLSTCKPDVYPDTEAVGVEIVRIKTE